MQVGVAIPAFDQFGNQAVFRRMVQALEELGYDSAWLPDHIALPGDAPDYLGSHWLEAMMCVSYGLAITSRLKFGADVLVAPYRNPVLLAKMAATAAELSNGRYILGLGIGWLRGEFEAVGAAPYEKRAEYTDECLRVIRLLYESKEAPSFKGKWVEFEKLRFEPKPARPLPMLVGGNHQNALRRAALLGDGWHPLFESEQTYAAAKAKIINIRRENGITRPFTFSYSCPQIQVKKASEAPVVRAVKTEVDPSLGTSYAPPPATAPDGRQRFVGTAEQLCDDFRAFAKAGVEQVVVRFGLPNDPDVNVEKHMEQLRIFAAEVLPTCASL
jgi:probable F420-dependent oxidoreductase